MVRLDEEAIQGGLGGLARSPATLSHVFATLSLPDKSIDSIEELADYVHVQDLDISGNCITDLKPLASLPHLLNLNASKNSLSDVLDFKTPHCTAEDAWCEGDGKLGSTLQTADLSSNCIVQIRDLSWHRFLRHLVLDHNEIERITGLESLQYLQVLSLQHNKLTQISGLRDLSIHTLHLDNNQITVIEELDRLPRLKTLSLANNLITRLDGLQHCTDMESCNLRANQVESIRQVEFLRDLTLCTCLEMTDNPLQSKEFYRRRVLVRLPRLTLLDGAIVSAEEKVKAENLHGADQENRKAVFHTYLPEEEFINYAAPFEEEEPEPQTNEQAAANAPEGGEE
jgi:Leucine-rich repeat (LRR) protein